MNPGKNAWINDGDPITIFGGIGFTDYTVSLTAVTFDSSPLSSRLGPLNDGAPAAITPCNASDPFQRWVWNTPANGYLSNSAASQCLNVYGCQVEVVYWSCVTSGGTCCGADCYNNLMWTLSSEGQLVTADTNGGCVTVSGGASPTLVISPCSSPVQANQTWAMHNVTGLLEFNNAGLCLVAPKPSPPPPPPTPYTQVR